MTNQPDITPDESEEPIAAEDAEDNADLHEHLEKQRKEFNLP